MFWNYENILLPVIAMIVIIYGYFSTLFLHKQNMYTIFLERSHSQIFKKRKVYLLKYVMKKLRSE